MGFSCPYCGDESPPRLVKEGLSAGGIGLFVLLLFCCFLLCWLPFVLPGCKATVRKCSACGKTIW